MGHKFVRIKLHGGSSYIQRFSEIHTAIEGEIDGLRYGEKITIDIEPVDITEEEYNSLPEFEGH